MTLTKYQRGEQMEGWNDCPSVMMNLTNSSSSSSLNLPRRRRVGSGTSINSLNNTTVSSRTPSLSLDKIRSLSTTSVVSATDSVSPLPSTSVSPVPSSTATQASSSCYDDKEDDISIERLISELDSVLELPTSMSERELTHYKSKLTSQFEILSNQTHLSFIVQILSAIRSKVDNNSLKNDIVQYMMVHEGTSGWCTPLKKIVTSLK